MTNNIRVEIDIRYQTEEEGTPSPQRMAKLVEGLEYQLQNLAGNGGLTSGAPELLVDTWKRRVYHGQHPLSGVDWALLKRQKLTLLDVMGQVERGHDPGQVRDLQGLLNLLDAIQDHEVKVNGRPEAEVFHLVDDDD